MPAEVGNVKLFLGPKECGAPDALLTPIVDAILDARESLVIATQQLEHLDIVNALAIARRRGVNVRVLLERDYIRESSPQDQILSKGGLFETNREALAALYRANINVRVERRARLMHQNFIVVDSKEDSAIVICTSANFTPQGMHRHLNHLLAIRDKRLSTHFSKEFESLWNDLLDSPHGPTPKRLNTDEMTIKAIFGPEQNPEQELTTQIGRAERSILFSISSFSTGSAIDDALISSSNNGIQVTGVMDGGQAYHNWSATDVLENAGISVYVTEEFLPTKLHHKLIVLDDSTLCLGTFNYSLSAARANEEVIITLEPKKSGSRTDLPLYAKHEVLRIQREFSFSASRLLGG